MNTTLLTIRASFAALGITAAVGAGPRPELESRPLAWTEFDGSYLVDATSRAEMVDFYWTVFARPFPAADWRGSVATWDAGTSDETWRRREYSQLNAYRALNHAAALREDTSLLPGLQEAALVLAANRRVSHVIDPSWSGYSESARTTLVSANLAQSSHEPTQGVVDQFVFDPGSENAALVGHRAELLHPGATFVALGTTRNPLAAPPDFTALRVGPNVSFSGTAAAGDFVAWPAPGFIPLALVRPKAQNNFSRLRWSFKPGVTPSESDFTAAIVSAKINGVAVPVHDQRYTRGWPITWEFLDADLNLATLTSDTAVEIEIRRATVRGQPATYRYTVTLFDEATIKVVGTSPRTPLVNLSTRGSVGPGERAMIAGFVVAGTVPVRVAIRAQGPGLARFGVADHLRETRLELFNDRGELLTTNSGWRDHQDWRLLEATGTAPTRDDEAGLVATLWPGAYTAVLSNAVQGTGLIEVFNIDNLSPGRLLNLSTRGIVGAGAEFLIAGFVIKDQPRRIVVRTQGPSLRRFGVSGVVEDTTLRLFAGDQVVAENDDWAEGLPLAPGDPREAAVALELPPGAYTAVVAAKGEPGVGLVEVFDLGPAASGENFLR